MENDISFTLYLNSHRGVACAWGAGQLHQDYCLYDYTNRPFLCVFVATERYTRIETKDNKILLIDSDTRDRVLPHYFPYEYDISIDFTFDEMAYYFESLSGAEPKTEFNVHKTIKNTIIADYVGYGLGIELFTKQLANFIEMKRLHSYLGTQSNPVEFVDLLCNGAFRDELLPHLRIEVLRALFADHYYVEIRQEPKDPIKKRATKEVRWNDICHKNENPLLTVLQTFGSTTGHICGALINDCINLEDNTLRPTHFKIECKLVKLFVTVTDPIASAEKWLLPHQMEVLFPTIQ